MSSFRTGAQCKARIKYLQDEYKRVKDHNSRGGNNRETFEYSVVDIDEVLGANLTSDTEARKTRQPRQR